MLELSFFIVLVFRAEVSAVLGLAVGAAAVGTLTGVTLEGVILAGVLTLALAVTGGFFP